MPCALPKEWDITAMEAHDLEMLTLQPGNRGCDRKGAKDHKDGKQRSIDSHKSLTNPHSLILDMPNGVEGALKIRENNACGIEQAPDSKNSQRPLMLMRVLKSVVKDHPARGKIVRQACLDFMQHHRRGA